MLVLGRIAWMLMVICVVVVSVGWFILDQRFNAAGPLARERTVTIDRGAGLSSISKQLAFAGVVDDADTFKLAARIFGDHTQFKAGEYDFTPHMTQAEVMERITSGKAVLHSLTIAEGLTTQQILQVIAADDRLTGVINKTYDEGSLLPETYSFTRGEGRMAVLDRMKTAMEQTLDELWLTRAGDLPFDGMYEALILASIVERETGLAIERPRVASVFVNRLNRSMRLQSDPTVIYGISKGLGVMDRSLTFKDLDTPSAYNTYQLERLPPGPIANPGRAALDAVLHPAATEYLYFVADGTGGHVFAKTLAEHNSNVANWRKVQRNAKTQRKVRAAAKKTAANRLRQ